jgi:hypothetical protein
MDPDRLATGTRFVGLGFSLAVTVVAALWAGNWLDQRWGTSPLFLLLFLVGGLFGFTRRLLWMLQGGKRRQSDGPAKD